MMGGPTRGPRVRPQSRLFKRATLAALVVALLSTAKLAIAEPAPATKPAAAAVDQANGSLNVTYESRPIGSTKGVEAGIATTNPTSTAASLTTPHSIGFDLTRMAIALAIVLALIFAARWLFTHFFAGARAPATSKAVKVLGKTSLAPRQQILLLQVGRRVVVVGESNGTLSTLSQIEDPDEVASLVGQLQEEQIQRAAAFGNFFGRAQRKMSADDPHSAPLDTPEVEQPPSLTPSDSPPTESGESEVRSELSGLLDKVRTIRNQLGR